jgi:hypothetical protein
MLSSELHLYTSLAYSLVSFISGLWRVSLAEYLLILRVYSLLLQMTFSASVIASIAFSLLGTRTRLLGAVPLEFFSEMLLWMWLRTGFVSELMRVFKNYVASATPNLVCNNLFELRCMWATVSYLWNVVTYGMLCWIMYDLGWLLVGLKSFEISLDYRSYMGSSAEIWSPRWLFFCTCALII